MKKNLFAILFFFLFINSYCQTWPKIYGGDSYNWCDGLIETYDKGFLINVQVDPGPSVSQMYGWLIKTDINGNILWQKSVLSSAYLLSFLGIDNTSDGGFIVAGATNKLDNENADIMYMKFNSCGQKEWCSILSTHGNPDYGLKIKSVTDGYILLSSYYKDLENKRIWLIKIDPTGSILWEQSYLDTIPDIWGEECGDLRVCLNGDFLISGYCWIKQGIWYSHPLFLKTSPDGIQQWMLPYGQTNTFEGDLGTYPTENSSGSIYSSARHYRVSSPEEDSPCFVKITSNGQEDYYKDLVSNSVSGGSTSLDLHNNDSLFISAAWHDVNNLGNVGIFKTDTLGVISKTKILFQDTPYGIHSTFFTYDDNYMAAGYFSISSSPTKVYLYKFTRNLEYAPFNSQPRVYDSLCPHSIISDTTSLDDCAVITKIHEPDKDAGEFNLTLFPNPVADQLTIVMPERILRQTSAGSFQVSTIYHQWDETTLEIYDLSGKLMLSEPVAGTTKSVKLDVGSWHSGMYAARVVYKNLVVAIARFVVK